MASKIGETIDKLLSDPNTSPKWKEVVDQLSQSDKLEASIGVIFHLIVMRQGMAASIAAYELMAMMYMVGYDAAHNESLAKLFEE